MSHVLYLQQQEQGQWVNVGPLKQVERLDGVELSQALADLQSEGLRRVVGGGLRPIASDGLSQAIFSGRMRGLRIVFLDHTGATVRLWQNNYQNKLDFWGREEWLEPHPTPENKET